jgi:hypothetical protein
MRGAGAGGGVLDSRRRRKESEGPSDASESCCPKFLLSGSDSTTSGNNECPNSLVFCLSSADRPQRHIFSAVGNLTRAPPPARPPPPPRAHTQHGTRVPRPSHARAMTSSTPATGGGPESALTLAALSLTDGVDGGGGDPPAAPPHQ